ncbi:MAG TPA: hypothetical protein VNW73_06440, partial [Ktedonobacteraceae bacterium]|nr:hypothetical protein [Ktedonobacteraceae bacterium]
AANKKSEKVVQVGIQTLLHRVRGALHTVFLYCIRAMILLSRCSPLPLRAIASKWEVIKGFFRKADDARKK